MAQQDFQFDPWQIYDISVAYSHEPAMQRQKVDLLSAHAVRVPANQWSKRAHPDLVLIDSANAIPTVRVGRWCR